MFCPHCGDENLDDARFCRGFGTALAFAAEAMSSSPSGAPTATAVTAQATDTRPKPFDFWARKGLAIAIGLLTVLVLAGSFPVGLILAALGACLWVGATGSWPSTRRRATPVVRVVLGAIVIVANAAVAVMAGYVAGGSCDYICGGLGLAAGIGIGIVVFVGAAVIEAMAILLVVGAIKLVRLLWRQADCPCTSHKL